MHIIVTVKQVLDPETPPTLFRIDEVNKKVLPPPGVAPVMNGYDANALEAALRLKEKHGARITVMTLGPASARDTLKRAIAMGADQAIHLDDPGFEALDSFGTARALASAIKKIGDYDLILCGRQASDTDAGQAHLGIAELLGLPGLTPVERLELADGKLVVHRIVDDGLQVIEVGLPAVVGVSSEAYEPRYPPLKGIMMAGKAQIPVWSAADLGIGPDELKAPKRRLRRLYVETREAIVDLVEADTPQEAGEKLALKLREAKLI